MKDDSPLVFPCEFPIKVVGRREDGFAQSVLEIVARHAPDFAADSLRTRASSGGAYLSLTCVITARSRDQLDALYRELSAHPLVKFLL